MNSSQLVSALLLVGAFAHRTVHAQPNPTPPLLQNILVEQRSGTMFVDITYDLVDPDSSHVYIIAEFSKDAGMTYGLPIFSLSGDIGPVRPGTGRHIIWNVWNDWSGNYTTTGRIRLTADDSHSALPPPPTNAPAPDLAWIPSGRFNMQEQSPGRFVWISQDFWMGRFEVTQGEYMAVMTNNPSAHNTGNTNLPVEGVTWDQAVQYCQMLTARERAAGRIDMNWAYRLPTEAEWEYACRAGTTNTFPYGEDPSFVRLRAYAWYNANSGNTTQPVGAKVPNQWGLFDTMGNVWEWCSDTSDTLSEGSFTDPRGPEAGPYKVRRGGSFSNDASAFAFSRDSFLHFGASKGIGFRVVLAPAL